MGRGGYIRFGLPATMLLASAAAWGAVPRGGGDEAAAALYRARGYPVCLSVNPLVARGGRVNGNAIEECHCAIDRLIARRDASGFPALDEGNARSVLGPYLEQCRGGKPAADEAEPGGKPAVEAEAVSPGDVPSMEPPVAAVPGDQAKADAPAWLAWTGLPAWAPWLVPVFALLAGLVLLTTRRQRGGRGDLTGPPPSMRGDAGIGPRPRD